MKKLIMANWKMQLSYQASLNLAKKFSRQIRSNKYEIAICPDYLALAAVSQIIKRTPIVLGAQDSSLSGQGAYTGEVSPANLKFLGVKYVIIGHSERRSNFEENSLIINKKIRAAIDSKLVPVLCIGETLVERQSGETKTVLTRQLRQGLKEVTIKKAQDLVIAYEPIWAISTNWAAKPMLATEADQIQEYIGRQAAKIPRKKIAVIYGGSVNSENAIEFLKQKNIAGLLVGGAILKSDQFIRLCS